MKSRNILHSVKNSEKNFLIRQYMLKIQLISETPIKEVNQIFFQVQIPSRFYMLSHISIKPNQAQSHQNQTDNFSSYVILYNLIKPLNDNIKMNFMNQNLNRGMTSMSSDQASEKLELFISCRNLVDLDFITVTDSFLVIKLQQTNKPERTILKTKVYDNNLNPDYAETVTIEYFFEIRQKLKFQVYHQASPPKLVGRVQSTLGQIFGSPNNGLKKQLHDNNGKKSGQIIIRCEKVDKGTNQMLQFSLQANDLPEFSSFLCFGSNTNSFYRIYRIRQKDELLIYESENQYGTNPLFKNCKLSQRRLCKNNPGENFQIRFYNYSKTGKHDYIGKSTVTVNHVLDPKRIPILDDRSRNKGSTRFLKVKRYIKSSFTDYIAAGLQLMLITCIDFTASNGALNSPNSLHFIAPNKKSVYEEALQEVSRILLDYDYDKLVPLYGFGAKCSMPTFNSYGQAHHCFPLNGNEQNAHVYMVEGILHAYREALKYLQFAGPTLFNVLLSNAISECYQIQKQMDKYMIVFILTDGDIHDEKKVIDQIVECCRLPISIIIVGVGNGPFDIMHRIDDDDCQLVDSKGNKTTRDLVQFVQFKNFRNNGVELAKEVLEELPRQVQQYYPLMNISPERLKANQSNKSIGFLPPPNMGGGSNQQIPYFQPPPPQNPYTNVRF